MNETELNGSQSIKLTHEYNRRQFLRVLALAFGGALIGGGLGAAGTETVFKQLEQQALATEKAQEVPQGYWSDLSISGSVVHGEINAYMLDPNLDVDHIDVAVQKINGNWVVLTKLTNLNAETTTYKFDADVSSNFKTGDTFPIAFNVYGTNGWKSSPIGNERALKVGT